jgi:preprotein translocase subunit SecD
MLHIEKWKIVLSILLTFLGIVYAVPNVMPEGARAYVAENLPGFVPHKTINLGLDLQGGSHLLFQADTKPVLALRMDGMVDTARRDMRDDGIAYTDLKAKRDGISFKVTDIDKDRAAVNRIARGLNPDADVSIEDDGTVDVTLSELAMNNLRTQLIDQSIEIVRRRVDESGTREPLIQRQGEDRIVVQLPGVGDPSHIKELIGTTAQMTFHMVDDGLSLTPGVGAISAPMREYPGQTINIRKRVAVNGDMLVDAQPGFDQNGRAVVNFKFDANGARRFCDVTRDNVGKPFAIKLDAEVISAPVINEAICGGAGMISGNFTVKEATDLALLLRAGALPAELTVVEERSVGPTLGSDSIAAGKLAAMVAFVFVFGLIWSTYGLFGLFANIALILNIIFIYSGLSLLQATLTLPGIAGIILTIGIAVDANVLIYERIREELRQGRSVINSIDTGYRLAFGTIVDSNLTTLIVSVILFSFGSGPIKGFAVAMCIGIVTSMFSAIMLTRMMVLAWLRKTRPSQLVL